MVQPLRALVPLPEDSVHVPAPTSWLTVLCNSSSRGSVFSSGLWAPGTQVVHRQMFTLIHLKVKISLREAHTHTHWGGGGTLKL